MEILKYEVFLDFNFKELTYKGSEKIFCKLGANEKLVLDAVGLIVKSVRHEGKALNFLQEKGKVAIDISNIEGVIEVEFEGKVKETGLVGIYKAPYNGKYIISTQFESSHAREFIPCVDHPAYKAIFKISVKVDRDLDVISNMPAEKVVETEDGKKVVEFKETPKMSTYLLYLGIGKFEEIRDKLEDIDVIVATVPGKISKGKLALEVAKKAIEFYNNYFGIKYQLPKEHLIAVPEFAFGAMENWGAITFRETALLADENSSFAQKRRVASVIAHELAHQWFGDLVTMKWWDDLWLNESFATFMSYKAVDALFPSWDFWAEFLMDETSSAMFRDSLSTTHPIEAHVESPEEAEQIFDDISYGKGASILRMVEAYIGKEAFQRGIQYYLQKYKFSNATGNDFWVSLEQGSGQPVSEIVKDWITKDGYPLIHVNVEGRKIRLIQERFAFTNTTPRVYVIPITLDINGKKTTFLMKDESVTIEAEEDVKSLKLNLDRTGFYRVLYDDVGLFFDSSPNHLERWGLLDDYYNFLLAGKIGYETYENIVRNLMNDDNYMVVDEIRGELFNLWSINTSKYTLINEFLELQTARWSSRKDENSKRIYGNLLRTFAYVDNKFAMGLAVAFEDYDRLDPNIKEAVATAYAIAFGEEAYDDLLKKYRGEKFDEERSRILNAMLSFREPYLVVNTLSLGLIGEIKRQDTARILPLVARNPYTRFAVWKWLETYMDKLREFYEGTAILGRSLRGAIPYLGINIKEVEDYFTTRVFPDIKIEIDSALEILRILRRLA
ncbi:M1 family metallopeptidase [Stygiolobus caldivivus]|uniref:Aminopeptidase n=1 Tax=Stygiolobus caldivivus TaxID=2824673 RepID=A0A8D5U745_9CREN|nr:M1 family metallopeptidase [Stygiolobus caldivivus]BCU70280.1 leucyl aminopeptidase [Stygiolobus caldivivus]